MKKTALILAAGQGTRMKSDTPKVLHRVCGKAMINHVIDAAGGAGTDEQIIVIGHGAEKVREETDREGLAFAVQEEQLGTGHAVMCAESLLPSEGLVLVLCGDTPLIKAETLSAFIDYHTEEKNTVSVLTAIFDNPTGYGRIVKGSDGCILRIVEEKDADEETKKIREINSGMYCFDAAFLREGLKSLQTNNAQGEYYLTDLIEFAVDGGRKSGTFPVENDEEIMGVNNRIQLSQAAEKMRNRINEGFMTEGVTFIDPKTVYIDGDVEIGRDTVVWPGAIITRGTKIGKGCLIGHNCRIENSVIGDGTDIQSSTIVDSRVGSNTHVGPYAYMRPNSNVGSDVKIGDFVEVKNANIGDGTKASHLAYIGDADVGKDVNIGCGVVFVNYDGIGKSRSVVEDEAFIGSNSNLVAPVHVEKHGYIAAGATITKTVPEGALVVARPKERVLEGWGERKLSQKKEKKNAK